MRIEEARKLINYYSPLLKGKIIEESTGAIINQLEIEGDGDNCRVVAKAPSKYGAILKRDIVKVAMLHNLSSVDEVLSDQGQ